MRDPSIHIKESDLRKVLSKVFTNSAISFVVEELVKDCKKYSCPNRSVTITNDKMDKKVAKLLVSNSNDVNVFNNILFMVRKSNKHFGFKKMDEGTRDWGMLKEITALALDFCNDFELDRKKGFTLYCDIGIKKMVKFSYPKLKSMYEGICQSHHYQMELDKDDSPTITRNIHDFYVQLIIQRTGNLVEYHSQPDNYYFFLQVNHLVKEKQIKFEDYIRAQFEGLSFRNGVPHPAQLIGDKANERLSNYLYEHGKKLKDIDTSEIKQGLSNLKNMGDE